MRELRFKAWDKKEKRWHQELVSIDALTGKCLMHYGSYEPPEVTDFIVCQCTGLKDKSGKKIYEGDIVQTNEAGWVAEVIYKIDGFFCIDNIGGFSTQCQWGEFEIIGNIYENPELLEGV